MGGSYVGKSWEIGKYKMQAWRGAVDCQSCEFLKGQAFSSTLQPLVALMSWTNVEESFAHANLRKATASPIGCHFLNESNMSKLCMSNHLVLPEVVGRETYAGPGLQWTSCTPVQRQV